MSRKLLAIAVVIIIILSGVGFVLFASSGNSKALKPSVVFRGYNRVFPLADKSFVIYTGHDFVRYSTDSGKFTKASPSTGAVLTDITVAPDGKSAVAFISLINETDPLVKIGATQGEWVTFDLEKSTALVLSSHIEQAYALDKHTVVVRSYEKEVSGFDAATETQSGPLYLWLFGATKVRLFEFNGLVDSVRSRANNNSVYILSHSGSTSKIWEVSAKESKEVLSTTGHIDLSVDGLYAYTSVVNNPDNALLSRPAKVEVIALDSKKTVWDYTTSSDTQPVWSGEHTLSLAYPSKSDLKLINRDVDAKKNSYAEAKDFLLNNPLGVVYATKAGYLVSSEATIRSLSDSITNIPAIPTAEEEFVFGEYSIRNIGDATSVYIYNTDVSAVINRLTKQFGTNAAQRGYRFIYEQSIDD